MKRILAAGVFALISVSAYAQVTGFPGVNPQVDPSSSVADFPGVVTSDSKAGTAAKFTSGALDGVTIGGTTPAATIAVGALSASPTTGSIFTITNNNNPISTNLLGYDILSADTTTIPTTSGTERPRQFNSYLSVPSGKTSAMIHENLWSNVTSSGAGTSAVEINMFHGYYENDATGPVSGNVEGYESSMLNNGALTGYNDFLSLAHNGSAGTVTNDFSVKVQYTNDNTSAGSIGTYAGFDCEAMTGAGSSPTNEYCIRNANAKGNIVSNGKVAIGTLSPSNWWLQVKGPDTSSGTTVFGLVNSSSTNLLQIHDDGSSIVNGVATVSCAANTVSLTTLVVTNGMITHC